MLRDRIQVTIPTPCHENWQTMTPTEKGRFCAACQKNVHDFTFKSDREIINTFQKETNVCGRFNTSQLNRELVMPKEKNQVWLATATTIISLIGLNNQTASAQKTGEVKTEQVQRIMIGKFVQSPNVEKLISGVISDENGPFPGANVVIKGTSIGTQTDLDGKFTINAKVGDTLSFHFLGMKEEQILITDKSNCSINLTMSENHKMVRVGGAISTCFTTKNRTFLGRVFHSIGNWFK